MLEVYKKAENIIINEFKFFPEKPYELAEHPCNDILNLMRVFVVACVVICVCHNLQFPDFVRLLDFHLHRQYEHVVLVVVVVWAPEHELILLLHFARGLTRQNKTTKSFPSTKIMKMKL